MATTEEFDDIPGTYLFDRNRSRAGYHLNMFCMSMMKAENRDAFRADEEAYLNRFPMTAEQHQAVLDRNWLEMIKLGGNIYYTSKLGATDSRSFQFLAGEMSGLGQEKYAEMMLEGGRPVDGNRSRSEQK